VLRNESAVVVGAGIGGLLAARVLSGYFERVVVVERDALPDGPLPRKGTPQARHLHSLAVRGSQIMEDLFPGLDAELEAAGCPSMDQALHTITDLPTGRMPRFSSGIVMRSTSRDLLEWSLRRRLREVPGMRFLPGREVRGLIPGKREGVVSGVRMRVRGDRSGPEEELHADLVLDASGQGSRTPHWLGELGYTSPPETVLDAHLGYASRWYRVPEGFDEDWKSLAVLPRWPDNPRGGSLRLVEAGRWTVVLFGMSGDYPPGSEEGFLRFARELPGPIIHDAIRDAKPLSLPYTATAAPPTAGAATRNPTCRRTCW
jgi:2-polyprenyl-6-methoxyphenol hydroxylase-like FAD-dependent oxidoreductase